MDSSWVLRVASVSWICQNCDDHIRPGHIYYRMLTGERFCRDCPPEESDACPL